MLSNSKVSTVLPKRKFIVSHNALKLYLEHRLGVRQVHEILTLQQSQSLELYIDFSSKKHKNVTNSLDKSVFELFNNCIYLLKALKMYATGVMCTLFHRKLC